MFTFVMYEYWFMFFVSILVASTAMLLGVGGALFFSPIFIILFPIINVTLLTPADALAAALITEVFGFSSGLWGYGKKKLIDFKTAGYFILLGIPSAVLGTIVKRKINGSTLILILGIGLWIIGLYSYYNMKQNQDKDKINDTKENYRQLVDIDNNEYEYMVCNQKSGGILAFLGGVLTGLLSVGIGETTVSTLRVKCGLPMKIASGTSVLVVTIVVLTSSITDILLVGIDTIPWNLVMFTIPGVLIGGQIGPKIANIVKPETGEKLLLAIFFIIGALMLII